jgi:multiple sugar transport system ATP-binding protein
VAGVRFEKITKTFGGDVVAVDDVSMDVDDGEFVVLVGPSGCGKTTLLRCLAGLEDVDAGRVHIGEEDVTDFAPRRRRIAMVFQSYAVFPHMKVHGNIAFGLRMQKADKDLIEERVNSTAELLHIDDLLDRYPAQLSGGQRQRIAVARALATDADVLLMDEPLSNLDALLRLEARAELKRLIGEVGTTTIYVTHDQIEALSMGDRIAVMNQGHIEQLDAPLPVYDDPVNMFVGGFIGSPPMNFVEARVKREDGHTVVVMSGGELRLPHTGVEDLEGHDLVLGIRAENISVAKEEEPDFIRSRVLVCEPLGSHNLLTVEVGDDVLKVATDPSLFPPEDSNVWLAFEPEHIKWMDQETGQRVDM